MTQGKRPEAQGAPGGGGRAPQPWGPPGRPCCLVEAPCEAVFLEANIQHRTAGTLPQGRGRRRFCPAELLTPRPSLPGASSSSPWSPSSPHGLPSPPALPTPLSDHRPLQSRQALIPASARHPSCCGHPLSIPQPGRDQPGLTPCGSVEAGEPGTRGVSTRVGEPHPWGPQLGICGWAPWCLQARPCSLAGSWGKGSAPLIRWPKV